jgi:23S rRNA (guanosine2251-2'-O)-methyltransferase
MEQEHHTFGIRAIIGAIQARTTVDKVYIQKEASSELIKDLITVMKLGNIKFSCMPVEKLNRITLNNHQGAVVSISPISFFDFDTLIENVLENGKKRIVFDFRSNI